MTDRLTEIRARLAAATPGSWTYSRAAHFDETRAWPPHEVLGETKRAGGTTSQLVIAGCSELADADLIASAPADLEWACAEIERLTREYHAATDLAAKAVNAQDAAFRAGAEAGIEVMQGATTTAIDAIDTTELLADVERSRVSRAKRAREVYAPDGPFQLPDGRWCLSGVANMVGYYSTREDAQQAWDDARALPIPEPKR